MQPSTSFHEFVVEISKVRDRATKGHASQLEEGRKDLGNGMPGALGFGRRRGHGSKKLVQRFDECLSYDKAGARARANRGHRILKAKPAITKRPAKIFHAGSPSPSKIAEAPMPKTGTNRDTGAMVAAG